MNPLESLMQPIARVLNRNIRESTRASELCERLDGKLIAIRVRDTALSSLVRDRQECPVPDHRP
jgi:ubiquinone biosynthesis protein UbiJ